METSSEITVNGIICPWKDDWTISDLLRERCVLVLGAAVELNCEIVPRDEHSTTRIQPNDRIEVVSLVGGG